MSFSVNTNAGALTALQYLSATQGALAKTQTAINSGMKVASARDDGAIYAIAQNQRGAVAGYQAVINSINNGTNAFRINSRQTSLGGSAGEAVGTSYYTEIKGTITVNAAGTLTVQFAQNAANGTSSILVGSSFIVRDNP